MCSTTCNTANVWAGNLPFRGHRLDRIPQHLQHYRLGLRPRPCSGPVQPRCCLLRLRPAGWCRPRRSLRDGIDYSTPTGRMLAGILAALAAYERELMHGRAAAGREAARLRGRHTGRPPRLSPAQARQVRSLRAGGETIGELVAGLRRLPGHHLPRPERRRRARAACLDCSRRAVTMSRRPTPISRSRPATWSFSKQHHEPFEETGALIWFIGSRPEPRAPHWAGRGESVRRLSVARCQEGWIPWVRKSL